MQGGYFMLKSENPRKGHLQPRGRVFVRDAIPILPAYKKPCKRRQAVK
jgi:hypothetical protein